MASLWLTEFSGVGPGNIQAPIEPALADQKITVGAETDSAALQANTRLVRLITDTACHVQFTLSGNPAATTSMQYLAVGAETFRWIRAGAGTTKVSVIAAV